MRSRSNRLLFAALLAALLSFVLSAGNASAASVQVERPDGQSVSVDLSTLTPDVNETYGSSHVNGFSLRAILVAAAADPVYRSVRIATSGGPVTQTHMQIESKQRPPALYESGGQVWFVYGSGQPLQVVGAISQVQSADDGPVAKIRTSRRKAKVRQPITYSVSINNSPAGQEYTYTWRFDDSSIKSGKSVKHAFKTAGPHQALLIARPVGASDSSYDVMAVAVVQVGAAVKSKKKRSGGGTNDAAGAPATGSADGRSGVGSDGINAARETKPKKKKRAKSPSSDGLTQVEGQLLSPEQSQDQPTVAARSGQVTPQAEQGSGITTEQAAGASALLLLGYGALLEMGLLKKFRPRMLRN